MEPLSAQTHMVVFHRSALFRRGLAAVIEDAHPEWDYKEAETFDELIGHLQTINPTVVMLDCDIPELCMENGLKDLIAGSIRHMFIALSDRDDRGSILSCLAAGARGFVLGSTSRKQFLLAIDAVIGGAVFAPASLVGIADCPPRPTTRAVDQSAPALSLTNRQREVFDLMAEGHATKVIARRLDLSVGTVKVHLATIYRTLGVNSRLEAITAFHRNHSGRTRQGLLPMPNTDVDHYDDHMRFQQPQARLNHAYLAYTDIH